MLSDPGTDTAGPKIGVYVCHCGGNISDVVDVARVAEEAAKIPGVRVARTNTFMCSDPGQNLILEDIQRGTVDRVVVAACSPSLHEVTFRSVLVRGGANPFLLEQANIREQCSWVHHNHEQATRKAEALVRMAVAKAGRLAPLEPVRVEAARRALVVGGGVAGLRAARDLSGLGIEVVLVEREPELGGFVRHLDRLYPDEEAAASLLGRMIAEVEADPKITVYKDARLEGVDGYVGNFTATVHTGTREIDVQAGVVVVATGFRPYEPAKREFGFGRLPQVLTLTDFVGLLARTPPEAAALEVDGRPVRSVGFIHCVGSRQVEGIHKPRANGRLNTHCSRVCCTATLQAACRLRQRFQGVEVHDFYQDIRTYGRGHEQLYERASRSDVIFHRYAADAPPKVKKAAAGDENALLVTVVDGLTWGEEIEVGVDLLVLAVGMVPADISPLVESLKLAVSADGFLQEVHPKLRPVEMAVNGVLLAGACQAPKDIAESCASASASAAKAAAMLHRGYVELAPYVARVEPSRCEGSGRCVKECPVEGAIRMVADRAEVNPALCTGCGCCVAVCPSRAIDLDGWTLDQFNAMVEAILANLKAA
jgi:heterodisulfide reductase subunit A